MMHPPQAQITTADNEMLITRAFNAPPELLWRAWTDPKQIVRWWGPIGFTTTSHNMDIRPGGVWRFDMHGPDGRTYPNRIVFEEVVPNQRLVYAHTGDDDVEDITFRVIVTFDRTDAGTKLTMRMIFPSADELQRVARKYGAVEGGIQTIGRLADHLAQRPALTLTLPSEREIIMSRTFSAPRARVWDTMTKPDLLRRWLFGPPGWTMTHCENNAVAGGTFRYAWRGPDNVEMAMKGVHKEVHPPERIVRTETFEFGCESQCGEQLGTLILTEHQGRTTLMLTLLYPSKEARDATIASGMEHGVAAGYLRVDDMLAATH